MKLVSTNPSRNYDIVGEVDASSRDDVAQAVASARRAQPLWAALPLAERCERLASFVEVSRKHAEDIAATIALETGRPIAISRANVSGGIEYLEAYLAMAKSALAPQVTYETATEIHRVHREPWGVIACICPWNYPYANVVWQCGQALIAGNTIIYKNSEENPLFAQLIARLCAESELPDGVFTVVYGDGQVGDWLAREDVDMISFTGSTHVGRALTKLGADRFIPVVTELGGSSPCLVFDDVASIETAADFVFDSRFLHSGQICSGIKRLIVHENLFEDLVERLCTIATTKRIGDAMDEATDLGPLVAARQLERLEAQVKDALDKGARLRCGGKRPADLQGAYYEPTVITDVTDEMRVWREEVFGPALPIISFATEEQAVELANDTEYGLGAHVLTTDRERFDRMARRIKSGMVARNTINYFHPLNPFGGYKSSGMGRVHGEFGFHEVTQIKLVSEEK